jgi:transposase InsO family protein
LIAPNLINLAKKPAQKPCQIWVGDMTIIKTREGWLYLAALLDAHSRKIVGWATDKSMRASLVCEALRRGVRQNPHVVGKKLILHSDQGGQYASHDFRALLKRYSMTPSMSRPANCYDNAMMESFWATLKTELLQNRQPSSYDEARSQIFRWIEFYYNRKRLHGALGYLSPVEFEISLT